ncbi:MAG: ATP-binding cassette domain-containing protein [Candidatus Pacebacteria bacterium]|nr:ATP-binding cassette domain-containing protein [Candidatus Paceibacterota bacterium]
MLKIKNLTVQAQDKLVLQDISLEIKSGEVHVLLGPNGSGKSSLAQVIMGNPRYQITQGKIWFKGQDITDLSMEKRVKLGLAKTFQDPPSIRGVTLEQLLTEISSRELVELGDQLASSHKLLKRQVNYQFSGGEKKLAELWQVIQLQPELIIFDELDSGVDLKNLERIIKLIKQKFIDQQTPVLFITHHGQIINGLEPSWTHVMLDSKIICRSQNYQQAIKTIKEYGYQKCRQCQFVDR